METGMLFALQGHNTPSHGVDSHIVPMLYTCSANNKPMKI
jgi:hypothetical protein